MGSCFTDTILVFYMYIYILVLLQFEKHFAFWNTSYISYNMSLICTFSYVHRIKAYENVKISQSVLTVDLIFAPSVHLLISLIPLMSGLDSQLLVLIFEGIKNSTTDIFMCMI